MEEVGVLPGRSPTAGEWPLVTVQTDPRVPSGTVPSLARRVGLGYRNVRLDLGEARTGRRLRHCNALDRLVSFRLGLVLRTRIECQHRGKHGEAHARATHGCDKRVAGYGRLLL